MAQSAPPLGKKGNAVSSSQDLILAVDDNEDALYALEQILLRNGFRVNTAGTGPDAIARAEEEPPAVILLDVVMPQLDGYQVTARLKADPALRFVPLILLTAKDSLSDIIKGLDRGADGYITKPFKPEELIARLRAALRLRSTTPVRFMRRSSMKIRLRVPGSNRPGCLMAASTCCQAST